MATLIVSDVRPWGGDPVAFPQVGVVHRSGTPAPIDAALCQGADLLGVLDPCAIDRDPVGQLDALFELAELAITWTTLAPVTYSPMPWSWQLQHHDGPTLRYGTSAGPDPGRGEAQ